MWGQVQDDYFNIFSIILTTPGEAEHSEVSSCTDPVTPAKLRTTASSAHSFVYLNRIHRRAARTRSAIVATHGRGDRTPERSPVTDVWARSSEKGHCRNGGGFSGKMWEVNFVNETSQTRNQACCGFLWGLISLVLDSLVWFCSNDFCGVSQCFSQFPEPIAQMDNL